MLVLSMDPLRLGLRRRANAAIRGVARTLGHGAQAAPESHEALDPSLVAHRDAGWVQLLDIEGQRPRGRGRLMLRNEGPRRDGTPTFEARIESFVSADEPKIAAGDQLLLLIETANEQYRVTVRTVEAGGSVVSVYWSAGEVPSTLAELGGE